MPRVRRSNPRQRSSARRGILFVISAPSGCGKTTLTRELVEAGLGLKRSVSITTRVPRKNEVDGKDYFFMTEEEFVSRSKEDEFLETARVFGNLYGTPRGYVEKVRAEGKDVILSIDVQGGMQVRKKCPDAVLIFITPPSLEDLRKRLRNRRTEERDEIGKRLGIAKEELVYLKRYDYTVVNDRVEEAVRQLAAIVAAERLKGK